MTLIILPDGKQAEFPEEMSLDKIKSIIKRKFPKNPEQQSGWLEKNANFAQKYINEPVETYLKKPIQSGLEAVGGFGQGLANIVPGLYNLAASGNNALGGHTSKLPMFDVVPNSPGKTAGEIGSFFSGPGALKSVSKLPELARLGSSAMKIPQIAEAIKHASNVLGKSPTTSRIAGNALLGGAYSPDNPALGMGLGAAGGAAGELASKGLSGIRNSLGESAFGKMVKNTFSKIQPAAQQKEIEHYLSGGTNSITKNSKELIKDIRDAYNSRNEEAGTFFNYALNKAGNQKIYKEHPMMLNKPDESLKTIEKIKDLNVGDLYHTFKANPTFANAHKLQSELFSMANKLESNPAKTMDDIHQISKMKSARQQLQNDISGFLERHDNTSNLPIGEKYKKGSELFKKHVSPYLENKKILDITRGGKTDIKNLHNVFESPSNTIGKNGIEQIGGINKIMKDLPENAKNRVLFNAIGGNKLKPEDLLNKLHAIESKGYGEYFSPEIKESMNALNKKIGNKELAHTVGKVAGIGGSIGTARSILNHLF